MTDYDSESTLDETESAKPSRKGMFFLITGMLAALAGVALLLIWYTGSIDSEPPGVPPVTSLPTPTTSMAPLMPTSTPITVPTFAAGITTGGAAPTAIVVTPAVMEIGREYVVGNTGGAGVNLRAGPSTTAERVASLIDGTRLEIAGPDVTAEGRTWKHVKDSNGRTGYVVADYLIAQ